jgi:hypothetical protein
MATHFGSSGAGGKSRRLDRPAPPLATASSDGSTHRSPVHLFSDAGWTPYPARSRIRPDATAKLLKAFPDLTVSKAIDAAPGNPATLIRYAQGLREAGLPEQ